MLSDSPWFALAYHYGVGGLLLCGILWASFRAKVVRKERQSDRRLVVSLVAGYGGFLLIHAIWIAVVVG